MIPQPSSSIHLAVQQLVAMGYTPLPIKMGSKAPVIAWEPLKRRDMTPDEADAATQAWQSGTADRIALIHRNGLLCIDIDARDHGNTTGPPVPETIRDTILSALGLPADYAWCGRSQGGRGWHLWLVAPDAPASGRGVIKLVPRPSYAAEIAHIEVRHRDCYTILPRQGDTIGYTNETLAGPPTERPWDAVLQGVMTIAEWGATTAHQRLTGRHGGIDVDDAHRLLDAAFTAERLAEWFRSERGGEIRTERNGEWRVLGQGGLLIRDQPGGAVWYCFADGDGGGWVKAIARTRYGGAVPRGGEYIALLRTAADFVGVPLPAETAPRAVSSSDTIPIDDILTYLNHDEAGDAQLFAALHAQRYRYDHAAGAWYEFRDHVWHALPEPPRGAIWGATAAVYLEAAAALQRQFGSATADEQARLKGMIDALTRRARELRKLKRINNVLVLAGGIELLGMTGDEWDRDPWLLAVNNGVLDLRTGELRPGQPDDYIRTQAPTEWRGLNEPAPHWERFISDILGGDRELVDYMQRLLGYACNGTVREHILVLLVGPRGRNGKGTLSKTLERVLGPYAGTVHTDVIVGQSHRSAGQAQPHVMSLRGLRMAFTSETNTDAELDAAQVKRLTGGDRITARNLHQRLQTWDPTHTLFVATNRRPHAPADDDALWERVHVIEFRYRYVDAPAAPDERRRDPALEEKLATEGAGILAWLVRGGMDWLREGLRPPACVRLARDAYRRSESIDPFLEARCIQHSSAWAYAGELYEAYKDWARQNELTPKSNVWFGEQMKARFERERAEGGRYRYLGVALRPDESDEEAQTLQTLQDCSQTLRSASECDKTQNGEGTSEQFASFCESFSMLSDSRRENTQTIQTLQTLQTLQPPQPSATINWDRLRYPCQMIWRTRDHDLPVTITGLYDQPGSDGRRYARYRDCDGNEGGIPVDELALAEEPAEWVWIDTGEIDDDP